MCLIALITLKSECSYPNEIPTRNKNLYARELEDSFLRGARNLRDGECFILTVTSSKSLRRKHCLQRLSSNTACRGRCHPIAFRERADLKNVPSRRRSRRTRKVGERIHAQCKPQTSVHLSSRRAPTVTLRRRLVFSRRRSARRGEGVAPDPFAKTRAHFWKRGGLI